MRRAAETPLLDNDKYLERAAHLMTDLFASATCRELSSTEPQNIDSLFLNANARLLRMQLPIVQRRDARRRVNKLVDLGLVESTQNTLSLTAEGRAISMNYRAGNFLFPAER